MLSPAPRRRATAPFMAGNWSLPLALPVKIAIDPAAAFPRGPTCTNLNNTAFASPGLSAPQLPGSVYLYRRYSTPLHRPHYFVEGVPFCCSGLAIGDRIEEVLVPGSCPRRICSKRRRGHGTNTPTHTSHTFPGVAWLRLVLGGRETETSREAEQEVAGPKGALCSAPTTGAKRSRSRRSAAAADNI